MTLRRPRWRSTNTCTPVKSRVMTTNHLLFSATQRSCDKAVCALCAVKEHQESKGHEIRSIDDVYLENRRAVEVLTSDLKHRQLSADDTLASIEEIDSKLESQQTSVAEEIDSVFDICQKIVERRRNELKNKLDAIVKGIHILNFCKSCLNQFA